MILVNVGPIEPENIWQRVYLLPFGRASVLFVVIAGVGMGFLLRNRGGRRMWSALLWRITLLMSLGLVLQTLTTRVSVILQTYAILFLLAPLLNRLNPRLLLGGGLVILLLGPAWIVHHDVQEPWVHGQGGVSLTTPPLEALHSLLLSGPYPLVSWVVPFVAGLLLSRIDLTDARVRRALMAWGAALAVLAFVVADLMYEVLGEEADSGYGRLLTGVGHGQMPLWIISSTAGAAFLIAACETIVRRAPSALKWLEDAGKLAFTIYVVHVLVLAVIKPADGFSFTQGVVTTMVLTSASVVLAALWARTGRAGPLEWLLRRHWLQGPTPDRPVTANSTIDRTP
ncbi:acyltransferase family protein [Ornithinimicrobium sp. Y1847]